MSPRSLQLILCILACVVGAHTTHARSFCVVGSAIGADARKAVITVSTDSGQRVATVSYDERTRSWPLPQIQTGMYRITVALAGHETQDVRSHIGNSGSVLEFVLGASGTAYIFQGYYTRPYKARPHEIVIFSAEPDSQGSISALAEKLGLQFLGMCGTGRDLSGRGKHGRVLRFASADTIGAYNSIILRELRSNPSTSICGPATFYEWNEENCWVLTNSIQLDLEGWVRSEDIEAVRSHPLVRRLERHGSVILVHLNEGVGEGATGLAREWSKLQGVRSASLSAVAPIGH